MFVAQLFHTESTIAIVLNGQRPEWVGNGSCAVERLLPLSPTFRHSSERLLLPCAGLEFRGYVPNFDTADETASTWSIQYLPH